MFRRCLLAAVLLLAIAVAACAPTAPARAPGGPLIEYRRTGGIAGFDDQLIIQADGRAELKRRDSEQTLVLSQAELQQLTAVLEQAQFDRLKAEYLPEEEGADLFDYVITYRGHTVHTQDTAVPGALEPVLAALNDLLAR